MQSALTPAPSVTIILTATDVATVLDTQASIDAVELGFMMSARAIESKVLGFHAVGGGFHVKSALMNAEAGRGYFVTKINANFPSNPSIYLPTIQGVVALFESKTGQVVALMDSASLTLLRTAAATAVAARALSNPNSSTLTIIGCGAQAGPHLRAISAVRTIRNVFVSDRDEAKAGAFAANHSTSKLIVTAVRDLNDCAPSSDIIVTCTSSRSAFLESHHVAPGAFIAAVGADNEDKQEISPALMAASKVIVDSIDQCAAFGDLHHALAAGAMDRSNVHGELSVILSGSITGRESEDETIIFDSTGVAFQDVVCAAIAYERAVELNLGTAIRLAAP